MLTDKVREANRVGQRILAALDRLGFEYENRDGITRGVCFKSARLDKSGVYLLMEVDTERIPRKVNVVRLTHGDTLHHLSAVAQKPVRLLNSTGVTYVVVMEPPRRNRLPRCVNLDLSNRPAGEYVIGIGESRNGEIWRPIDALGHLLVAGSTGSGKSAFLRLLLYQMLRQSLPVELYLADLEGLTFAIFEGVPALRLPVAGSVEDAEIITARLMTEMQHRSRLYAATGRFPETLAEYHAVGGDRLPWVMAVFDEFTAFVDAAGQRSQFYEDIGQLAMRSRKYGITLVFAGQDFKADLLNTRITNQVLCRIQFRCATDTQSRVTLGTAGAEHITQPGRALVSLAGSIPEVQTFWINKAEIIDQLNIMAPEPADVLAERERWIYNIARYDLGGSFAIDDIYSRTGSASEGGVSRRWLVDLAKRWERAGWLERDESDPTAPRRLAAELAELVERSDGR